MRLPAPIVSLLALAAVLGACGSQEKPSTASPDGRRVFLSAGCAGCHVLRAAGSHGYVGPDLDTLVPRPDRPSVLMRLNYGAGGMPSFKGKLSRAEMEAVASFVARSAGRR